MSDAGHSVGKTVASVIVGVRVMYAIVSSVADCDEVFNYWEPTHQLMYGKGLQTWEYSPDYGLRSYLYLMVNAWPGVVLMNILPRYAVFMATRVWLVCLSGYADSVLISSVADVFGRRVGWILGGILVFATGPTMAAFCFLPSSFTLMCLTAAFTNQLSFNPSRTKPLVLAIFFSVTGVILGWPFIGLIAVPMGLHAIYTYSLLKPLVIGVAVTVALSLAVYQTDTVFYGRPLMSTWELVKYNVLGCLPYVETKGHTAVTTLEKLGCFRDTTNSRGSHLYGVEGPEFFFKNLFLNFNIVFVAAMASPLLTVVRHLLDPKPDYKRFWLKLVCIAPFFVWFVFWLFIPHKEERFMVPVYSILCFAAAVSTDATIDIVDLLFATKTAKGTWPVTKTAIAVWVLLGAVFCVLSVSRSSALIQYYSAPLAVMYDVSKLEGSEGEVLCMGRDWYRFMSHYFVPEFLTVAFIDDGFKGLLPKYFTDTAAAPPGFNDLNQADPAQFTPLQQCTYLVTTTFPSDDKPSFTPADWDVVSEAPLLDAGSTATVHRAFVLPASFPGKPIYGKMSLLKRK